MARTPVPYYAIYGHSLVVHTVSKGPRGSCKWPPFLKIVSPERRCNIYLEIRKFENSKGRRRVVKSGSSFALKRRRKKRKEEGTLDEISARPVKKRRKKKREGEKISGGRIERKMQLLSSRYYRFLRMRRMPRVYIRNFVWPCEGPT